MVAVTRIAWCMVQAGRSRCRIIPFYSTFFHDGFLGSTGDYSSFSGTNGGLKPVTLLLVADLGELNKPQGLLTLSNICM